MGFAQHYLKQEQNKLEKLFFHNDVQTFNPVKGVVAVALKLAIIDGVSYTDRSYERIGLASALYDIDNIVQRQLHEQISIDDSREMLFELKYDEEMISGIASCNKSTEIDYSKGCPKRKVHSRGAKIVSDADLSNPGFFDVTNFAFESIKLWLEVGKFDFTEFVVKGAEFTHCLFNSIGDYYTGAARFSFPKNRKQNMANLQTEIERIMRLCNGDVNRLKAMLLEDDKRLMTLSDA